MQQNRLLVRTYVDEALTTSDWMDAETNIEPVVRGHYAALMEAIGKGKTFFLEVHDPELPAEDSTVRMAVAADYAASEIEAGHALLMGLQVLAGELIARWRAQASRSDRLN